MGVVAIVTKGRVKKQITYDQFSPEVKKNIVFVVSKEEAPEHLALGRKVILCPLQGTSNSSMGSIRQWLVEYMDKPFIMMDDDIRFYKRTAPGNRSLIKTPPDRLDRLIVLIVFLLRSGYAHVTVNLRSNFVYFDSKDSYTWNTHPHGVIGINPVVMRHHNIRYRLKLHEDIDVALQLLRAGYAMPNIVDFASMPATGYNEVAGGCDFRSAELFYTEAEKLLQFHRDFITPKVPLQDHTPEDIYTNYRHLFRIQWKKALRSSGIIHGNYNDPVFEKYRKKYERSGLFFQSSRSIISYYGTGIVKSSPFTLERWKRDLESPDVTQQFTVPART